MTEPISVDYFKSKRQDNIEKITSYLVDKINVELEYSNTNFQIHQYIDTFSSYSDDVVLEAINKTVNIFNEVGFNMVFSVPSKRIFVKG